MQKPLLVLGIGVQLMRQSMSRDVSYPWVTQVRHGHGRRLAIARDRERKIQKMKGLPFITTSRMIEAEDEVTADRIALSKDGRVIACWHPELPFPYEMTKPISLDVTPTDSRLKLQALVPVREVFRKKHTDLVVRELMQLTYTAKYRWYCQPKRRDRLLKQDVKGFNPVREREYL